MNYLLDRTGGENMQGKVIYNEQEQSGNYVWTGIPSYMTDNFKATFGDEAEFIASYALTLILEKHPHDADYFQTFKYIYPNGEAVKFWLINDIDHSTALMPSEH